MPCAAPVRSLLRDCYRGFSNSRLAFPDDRIRLGHLPLTKTHAMSTLIRSLTCSAVVALALSACASAPAPVAQAPVEPKVVEVAAQQPTAERDVHGAYRFNMSEGGKKMSADEFDAWMKANGIRVARGNAAPAAEPAKAEAAESSATH